MSKQFINFEIYLVNVNEDKCDGCKECFLFCPCDVFLFSIKAFPVKLENCLGCRVCEEVCKSKAIIITEI